MSKVWLRYFGQRLMTAGPDVQRRCAMLVVAGSLVMTFALNLIVRQDIYFKRDILASDDYASNDMQIVHGDGWLHGNYSATGFYHPGPAQLVIMRAGEILLYRVLPVFHTPFAAQIFSTALFAIIALGLLFYFWIRATRSIAIGVLAMVVALITLQLTAGACPPHEPSYIMKPWAPDYYVSCAVYFATGCLGLLCFGIPWLPLALFGACLLIHGHASFIVLVPIMGAVGAFGAWIAPGQRPRRLADLLTKCHEHRASLALSAAVVTLFALPVLIGIAIDPAVDVRAYLSFARHEHPQSPAEAIAMLRSFLPLFPLTVLPCLLPASLAGAPAAQARFGTLRGATLVVFAAGLAAACLYAFRGAIGEIVFTNCFLLLWFAAFSAVLAGGSAALLALVIRRISDWAVIAGSVAAIALFATPLSGVFAISKTDREPAAPIRHGLAVIAAHVSPGEMLSASVDASSFWSSSDLTAMLALMWRDGHRTICVAPGSWAPAFHVFNRCNALTDRIDPEHTLRFGGSAGTMIAALPHGSLSLLPVPSLTLKSGVRAIVGDLTSAADAPGFGWSPAESGWLWSDGEAATLRLHLAPCDSNGPARVIRVRARAHLAGQTPRQELAVTANGQDVADWVFTAPSDDERIAVIPAAVACRPAPLTLMFRPLFLERPNSYGLLADRRRPGIALMWIELE